MARVTVEDCIDKVDSPYELVLVAKERATQLNSGIEPSVDQDNDKNTVIALREIAIENVKVNELTDSAVYKLRKHVEQIDESSEEDEEVGDDFEPKYSEVAPKFLPDANNLILVRTSETSGMSIAIYKDEKTADDYLAFREEIESGYQNLSTRLRQIAQFALDHPTEMSMETVATIAKKAGVQPSSVIRFAKNFGYSGFSEMQRVFQAYVVKRSANHAERIRRVLEGE